MNKPTVSLVILTYNRKLLLQKELDYLRANAFPGEVIVVDNHSQESVRDLVDAYDFVKLIELNENVGVGGRNAGMKNAQGDIIITIDDDIVGITKEDVAQIINVFQDQKIGAVCFKVIDEETNEIINWCHHRKLEHYHDKGFLTEEITEGAVAFRRVALESAGYYPEEFFISHEGPDLALRLMNSGFVVRYTPDVIVKHSHSSLGRPTWRAYYYDTRNLIWLVLRNYPFFLGIKKLFIGLNAMLFYSIRDGYLRFWIKGLIDGAKGAKLALGNRTPMSSQTKAILREIGKYRPDFWYMVKRRVFNKGKKVEIL